MNRNMVTVTMVNLRVQDSSEIIVSSCLETRLQQRPKPACMGTFNSSPIFSKREQHVPLQIWKDPRESLRPWLGCCWSLELFWFGPGLWNARGCPFNKAEERRLTLKCCTTSSPAIPMLDRLRFKRLSSALMVLTLERRRCRRMFGFLMLNDRLFPSAVVCECKTTDWRWYCHK